MKDKIEKLLKEQRKTKADLSEALGITYQGLQHKLNTGTFKFKDIDVLEKFFDVENGYFSMPEAGVENTNESWKEKYFNSLEVINRLMFIVNQNGIKIDGLGKFDVSGLHGVKIFCSY